jgi:excisionase family DNA binding protein
MSISRVGQEPNSDLQSAPLAVSVKKACELIDVGQTTMWAMIRDGRVSSIKIGKKRLIIYKSLEQLLRGDSK